MRINFAQSTLSENRPASYFERNSENSVTNSRSHVDHTGQDSPTLAGKPTRIFWVVVGGELGVATDVQEFNDDFSFLPVDLLCCKMSSLVSVPPPYSGNLVTPLVLRVLK